MYLIVCWCKFSHTQFTAVFWQFFATPTVECQPLICRQGHSFGKIYRYTWGERRQSYLPAAPKTLVGLGGGRRPKPGRPVRGRGWQVRIVDPSSRTACERTNLQRAWMIFHGVYLGSPGGLGGRARVRCVQSRRCARPSPQRWRGRVAHLYGQVVWKSLG